MAPLIPTLTSVNIDSDNASGGSVMVFTGTNFQADAIPKIVSPLTAFNSVIVNTSTQITATVPAYSGSAPPATGTAVNLEVVQAGGTSNVLTGALTYYPTPTFSRGTTFSAGTNPFANFLNNGSGTATFAIDTQRAYSPSGSTFSAHCQLTSGSGSTAFQVTTGGNPMNDGVNFPQGVWIRWRQLVTQAFLDTVIQSGHQGKWYLNRDQGTQNNYPGWLMIGTGNAFKANNLLTYVIDNGTNTIGDAGFTPLAETWYDLQVYQQRISGVGYTKVWIAQKSNFTYNNSLMGTDTTSGPNYYLLSGLPFGQFGATASVFVATPRWGNGYSNDTTVDVG